MELLPCPFCGSADISIRTRKTTSLECNGCGALFIKAAHEAAAAAWNTRTFSAQNTCQVICSDQRATPYRVDRGLIDKESASLKRPTQKQPVK